MKDEEMEFTMGLLGVPPNKRDAEIQVSFKKDKRQGSSVKGRKFSSNMKQTPKRNENSAVI